MKCQNCGNNNAVFHYKVNINGQKSEQHLCAECAEKAGLTEENLFGGNMFDSMFADFFTPARSAFFPEFSRFMMPVMTLPRIEFMVRNDEAEREKIPAEKAPAEKDEGLSLRRELNVLREQMKSAVSAEDFEKAAELRDKIRELEKKQ
jgi:Uncharacterized protein with conserved CXXC pairs